MHPEDERRRERYERKLVAAARAILTNDVALPQGVWRLARVLHGLAPLEEVAYPAVDEYVAALRKLEVPLGTDRLRWNRDRLAERDGKLWRVTEKHRPRLVRTCWEILDRYAPSPWEGP